ncbi:prepilin-type N-terminal cleavage/methylation domain-containing protein [Enterobacter kobei]|uniref:PulJ/GspJ family protein n=1 Tax=Enterobacter kobei TaxID=208224 RepID=UPI002004D2CC|nr:prepilin-type N-terminal cleavage/methylation domain-containing protein [Enterobacter kobei]MCK6826131.1 prepilin-type N-terminal cleavage/methylation domain-containing protein [Enterobacter kobei]
MSKVPNGFTLLEVMLAIVIFSTLSFLASQVFSQATEQYQRAKKTGDDFEAIQHTVLMLENDLMQYVPRKNRQTPLPFLSEKESVIFTTQTRDPAMPFGATFVLTTVHWYVENDTLFVSVQREPY